MQSAKRYYFYLTEICFGWLVGTFCLFSGGFAFVLGETLM